MGNTLTIFDLDNTLIQGDSSTVWSQFMVREGLATQKGYLAREARLMADYDRGEMNIADYVALIQAPLAGIPKSDVDALVARCVREAILPRVYPQAWELIRRLRAEGEQMLIISASVSLLVQAVAAALEIDQALGIDVAMVDGGYSGEITGIPSYQQGKVARLAQWREAHPQYDGEVTFYTDSINDLPLCLHADRVRLVNPCPQLQAAGAGYGWNSGADKFFYRPVGSVVPVRISPVGRVRRQPPPGINAAPCLMLSPGGAALTGPTRCDRVRGPGRPGKA
jgi:HAD superfamily hydrolase (TIGR01490 family)